MQKKNFLNNLTTVMLLLASFTMVSCDDVIDVIFSKEDNTIIGKKVAETIATVTDTDPAAVSNALQAIVTDEAVAAAAAKGEPIKVTLAGSGVSTGAADQTITIPQKNGAAIEINFASAPTGTESNALVLQADKGAGALPGDAKNNLTVTMPPSEGLAVTIELPTSTVTLKTDGSGNVAYKDVIAKTATSTIIIDKGVTIKEHELVGGNIVVKDGGAIETIAVTIKDNLGLISLGSWWSAVWFKENGPEPEYEIKNEDGSPYVPKNLRVKKGKGDYSCVRTVAPEDEYVEKLIIGEGVTVAMEINSSYKVIQGEGENKAGLNVRGWIGPIFSDWNNPSPETITDRHYTYDFSTNTEKVSNVTITEERGEINPWNIPFVDQQTDDYSKRLFAINFKGKTNGETTFTFDNCAFPASSGFNLSVTNYKRDADGKIVYGDVTKYCCFWGEGEWDIADYPTLEELQAEHPELTQEVGDRERGGYWKIVTQEPIIEEMEHFTGTLILNNCTIGGAEISSDGLINSASFEPFTSGTVSYKVKINNTVYNVNRDTYDNNINLTVAE